MISILNDEPYKPDGLPWYQHHFFSFEKTVRKQEANHEPQEERPDDDNTELALVADTLSAQDDVEGTRNPLGNSSRRCLPSPMPDRRHRGRARVPRTCGGWPRQQQQRGHKPMSSNELPSAHPGLSPCASQPEREFTGCSR